jgi:3-deoxy-D-manno-octulosonate 8-phosphate phosphatase (KDO 8-P phosphatase)
MNGAYPAGEIPNDVIERAARIRLAVFDVDGVLTDGRLYFDEQGREYKGFHARDGHGLKMLQSTGVDTAVISGRKSESVARRMENLGIRWVFQGIEDKLPVLLKICEEQALLADQVAYVGDDLLDLAAMSRVGLSIAVADAHFSLLGVAHWRTRQCGGAGAVREVCDLLMHAQGTLPGVLRRYL